MSAPAFKAPRFATHTDGQPFFQILTQRVNQYFKEHNKSSKGDVRLYTKTGVLLSAFFATYVAVLYFGASFWIALPFWIILGLLTSAIGFNVMHDGAHGSYSKYEWLNSLAGHTLSMLGASVALWKNKHNAIHHTFTNIDGLDDDIDAGGMIRMAETQPHKGIHKMQHYYRPVLYSLLYIYWLAFTDFKKYFTGKVGDVPIRKFTFAEHVGFWMWKTIHTTMVAILPIYLIGFWPWFFGFLLMASITGLSLSVVFQLAHVVEGATFAKSEVADPTNIESEWAVHQLQTTANFATRSRILTWLLGGLNFQVEHHLFPRISHVHYPAISRIVKETCAEFNVQYQEFRTFADALGAHVRHLKRLSVA